MSPSAVRLHAAAALLLVGCRGGGEKSEAFDPSLPPPDTVAGVEVMPPGEAPPQAGPGEVIALDTAVVQLVVIDAGGAVYEVKLMDWTVTAGGVVSPADRRAVRAWLGRFAPLRADGPVEGAPPEAVRQAASHRVTFVFDDGSERAVEFQRTGDGLAVVSQDDGPVWRLAASRLAELAPPPASLR